MIIGLKNNEKPQEIFYPLNEKTSFKINQRFREFTRNKKREKKIVLLQKEEILLLKIFIQVLQDLNLKIYVIKI